MNMTLTNNEIYNYANALAENFMQDQVKFPIKINFYLQKNMTELVGLAQDIEKQRLGIAQEYGILDEETQNYNIPKENVAVAQNKLEELFDLTQDVKIYKVKLKDFGNMDLTSAQMQALLFMIEEEED